MNANVSAELQDMTYLKEQRQSWEAHIVSAEEVRHGVKGCSMVVVSSAKQHHFRADLNIIN